MRSDTRFVMHPDDEAEFAKFVTSEAGTAFVDGPSWKEPRPTVSDNVEKVGSYLMIWNSSETPELIGEHYQKEESEWWYCKNEFLTVQFLRSGFQFDEPFLLEGRIAVCTTAKDKSLFHAPSATAIELRYKSLRRFIRKYYANGTIIWQALSFPRSKTNPLKPDSSLWVGPHAMRWLEREPEKRWVQQSRNAGARGYLVDLIDRFPNHVEKDRA
jgi:hypothetical protein